MATLTEMKFQLRIFLRTGSASQKQIDMLEYGLITMVESWLVLIAERDGKNSLLLQVALKSPKMGPSFPASVPASPRVQ